MVGWSFATLLILATYANVIELYSYLRSPYKDLARYDEVVQVWFLFDLIAA
jgi:hypothetical protein